MIPMRTSSVFKSRWMALLWAAGIIWFAVDYAESKQPATNTTANTEASAGDDGSGANSDDVKTAADALGM
jgi:hypothetical protein